MWFISGSAHKAVNADRETTKGSSSWLAFICDWRMQKRVARKNIKLMDKTLVSDQDI
jgi:hypothetical protein